MNQTITTAMVLARTNYQEADRIVTFLTPDYGKVRVLAKGVRKSKSKLAGGVELFSVAEIGFLKGKGDLATLVSARLKSHYGNIVKDLSRTMLGYDLIKLLNKVTEDNPEPEYFDLLQDTYAALDQSEVHTDIIKLWFYAQLLRLAGHTPNLQTDTAGQKLQADQLYVFDYDAMAFTMRDGAIYGVDHIKLLRLALSGNRPHVLQQLTGIDKLLTSCLQLLQTVLPNHIRV